MKEATLRTLRIYQKARSITAQHQMGTLAYLILLLLSLHSSPLPIHAKTPFDVRHHLATVTRYKDTNRIAESFEGSELPDQCTPIHLNLVARHGTRAPTKKKLRSFEDLAIRLKVILQNAKDQKQSLKNVPAWLWGWESPWKGKVKGGELISHGEDELYHLGIRLREKFPELLNDEYHPDVYSIKATQIPRASASAVAFGMGLFNGKGNLGPGNHRAFAVTSESRSSDIVLRFHDCCQNYKAFRKSQEPGVNKLKEPVLDEIAQAIGNRYGPSFTRDDVSSLWSLCRQEASLLDLTEQACALFSPSEVALLEWTDDVELFILKGYGNSLNYRMGVPLLDDVIQSMEQAIKAKEGGAAPGSYEKARLRFAHAETLLPFSCLIGLFLEGPDYELIRREESLELPPKPPQRRIWRGSTVAPFAGNNVLVLYSCKETDANKYFVQVFHNEKPIPVPGCNSSNICPLEVFKGLAEPHLKHTYTSLCSMGVEKGESAIPTSKLSQLFSWLFSSSNVDKQASKAEL